MTDSASNNYSTVVFQKQVLADFVGEDPTFRKLVRQLPELAAANASVLIEGETGTGKELAARGIHYLGPRAPFPFIPVNCGAFADTLLQDELFGHERGAYTDARVKRPGLIAQAESGTLFLDEVDSLTSSAQVSLLRVLQDGTFRALGSSREQRANVRFVAATNSPLYRLVEAGTFRIDLYYRLCVFSLRLPPLRERGEDVLRLASHFVHKHARSGADLPRLSPGARSALLAFDWPGNVRELENAIIRGMQHCHSGSIEVADLALGPPTSEPKPILPACSSDSPFNARKKQMIEAFERQLLTELLSQHHGNITRAAQAAGRERRDFGKLLKKYQIDASLYAPSAKRPPAIGAGTA